MNLYTKIRSYWSNKRISEAPGKGWVYPAPGYVSCVEEARCLPPYDAALRFYQSAISSLPLPVYKRGPDGSRERQREHPVYKLLNERPNQGQSRPLFIKQLIGDYWVSGEFFVWIRLKNNGEWHALHRIDPCDVRQVEADGEWRKTYTLTDGTVLTHDEVIHVIRDPDETGLRGINMFDHAGQNLGLHKSIQDAASAYYSNAARPSMYGYNDKATGQMVNDVANTWKAGFKNEHQGTANTGSVPFVNFKLEKFPRDTAEDAALLEAINSTTAQVGQWFNLSPLVLGDLTHGKYNSLAAENQAVYAKSIRPVLEDIESEFNAKLFGLDSDIYCQFLTESLLRGDPETQARVDQAYVTMGVDLRSEVRERKDMPFIPGSDTPLFPLNMGPEQATDSDNGGPQTDQPADLEQPDEQPADVAANLPDEDAAPVQDAALNGAQIASLLAITDKVATGLYPAPVAEAIIKASFPLLSPEQVAAIIGPLASAPKVQPQEGV